MNMHAPRAAGSIAHRGRYYEEADDEEELSAPVPTSPALAASRPDEKDEKLEV
jgi:hypothetical protein